MENLDGKSADSSQSVRVAVNIRPLITPELMVGCTDCITVVPGEPQVLVLFLFRLCWICNALILLYFPMDMEFFVPCFVFVEFSL